MYFFLIFFFFTVAKKAETLKSENRIKSVWEGEREREKYGEGGEVIVQTKTLLGKQEDDDIAQRSALTHRDFGIVILI